MIENGRDEDDDERRERNYEGFPLHKEFLESIHHN